MAQNETPYTQASDKPVHGRQFRTIANEVICGLEGVCFQRVMVCSVSGGAGRSTLNAGLAHQLQSVSSEVWTPLSFETWLAQDETPSRSLIDGFAWDDDASYLAMDHQNLQRVDAIVLVCMERQCNRQQLKAMLDWSASVKLPVIGVVFNHYKTLPLRQRVARLLTRFKRRRSLRHAAA